MRKKNGFTLTELLAVISILAAIIIIATPIVLSTMNKSKKLIKEEDKKTALEAVKTYLSDIENGVIKYKAPKNLEVNGNTYSSGSEMKTYDAITYISNESDGIDVPITLLIEGEYIDPKCNYDTNAKKCKFKRECTFKGYMDGDTQDGYVIIKKYRAEIGNNCN